MVITRDPILIVIEKVKIRMVEVCLQIVAGGNVVLSIGKVADELAGPVLGGGKVVEEEVEGANGNHDCIKV